MSKKLSVFLSHSSKDNKFVQRLEKALKKNGIEVWVDYDRLDVGDSLYGKLAPAIYTSDYFVLIWSENSQKSRWVRERELNAALAREDEEDREIILPVLLDATPRPDFLKHQVYADFTSEDKFDESLKKLAKAIKRAVPKAVDEPSTDKTTAKLYPNQFLPDLKFFVGREELLKQIRVTLDKDHRAAIHDISGLGKTFTTYKFAEDNQGNYDHIFFIRATREEMLESLAKCSELVEPEMANVTEQQAKALGFKQWLEENENWLVIYDNVDLPDELFKYVPVNKKGDCLFTSNFREVRNLGTEISIVKLDRTDAEVLLYSRANNTPLTNPNLDGAELAAFDRLIEEIDGLPLTLNSTGALIDKKQWSFSDMWQRYEKSNEILWDSEDKYSGYQKKSAGIVFSLAYDEISSAEKIGNTAKLILDRVSFISPDEIPEELFTHILWEHDQSFTEAANPEVFWDDVREKLTDYDLLKYNRQKETFTTHRAIQRVIQSSLKGKEKEICISLAAIFRELFPRYDYSNREECEKYYQHVLILLENADKFGAETKDTNGLYFAAGRYQRLLGNYGPAEKSHLRAAETSASVFGEESETHSRDLDSLAIVYLVQGRYDEAIENLKEAQRIDEMTIGREHPNYAVRLNNLASVYHSQGRYDEAIEKYEEALRIDEKTIGYEDPGYAAHLNNLGEVYRIQGRYDEAIEKHEKALRIVEKTIGREHPDYAKHLNNLGEVYRMQGRYDEAIGKYEEAFRINEKTLGPEHPLCATQFNNIALVNRALGRYDEAINKYEKALRIAEKTIGCEHPDYAVTLCNLARVYEEQEKFQKALDLFKTALRIWDKTLPGNHPNLAHARRSVERCGKLVN